MKLDLETFRQDVYSVVAAVPRGKLITYGQIAMLAGRPQNARLAGNVLHQAPYSLHLPCHRVVNSSGRCAPHWAEQRLLLEAEGVTFKPNGCADMRKHQWRFMEIGTEDTAHKP